MKKKIIIFITIFIFTFFLANAILFVDRSAVFKLNVFKIVSNNINNYFVSRFYEIPKESNNILNMKIKYLKNENNNLKALLDIKKERNDIKAAFVTNSLSKALTNTIYIKTNKKVNKGDIVINQYGFVGFIKNNSKLISEVNLISGVDDNNSFSVFIKSGNNNILGVLSDYDKKKNLFKIKDVITNTNIKKNDKVVLKGYDDIYIGDVVKCENDDYNLSKIVWVKSYVDFDDLLYVLVVER